MAGELIKAGDVLHIGQRLEVFIDGREERFSSRIEDITDEELIAAMPFDKHRVPVIPRSGELVYMLAVGGSSRYRFLVRFRGVDREGLVAVWRVAKPDTCEKFQDRAFVRVKVSLHTKVRLVDEEGCIEEPVVTQVVDLSGNGICFAWNSPIKVGTQAGLELNEIPGVGTLEVMSEVVRCTPVQRGDGEYVYHIGASFKHLSRSIANKIVRYVFDVQRKIIAKGIRKD